MRIAEALEEHPDSDNIIAAVVIAAEPKKLVVALQSGEQITIAPEGLKAVGNALTEKAGPKQQIRRGAVIRIMQDKQSWQVVLTYLMTHYYYLYE